MERKKKEKKPNPIYLFLTDIEMYSPPPPRGGRPYQLAPIQGSRFSRPVAKAVLARDDYDGYGSSNASTGYQQQSQMRGGLGYGIPMRSYRGDYQDDITEQSLESEVSQFDQKYQSTPFLI